MNTLTVRSRALVIMLVVGLLAVVGISSAAGHATAQKYGGTPTADGYGAFWMRIPHGCMDAKGNTLGTTRVVVFLPNAFQSAKPQQIAGWKSSVRQLKSGVRRVQWVATGAALRDDEFQDFGITVQYPAKARTYGLPTIQYCGASHRTAWIERMVGDVEPEHPMPTITVSPAIG